MSKKRKNKASKQKTIFFVYQSAEKSGNSDNVDAILNAVKQIGNTAVTWENMKVNGKFINKDILRQIDNALVFACDMTYLNANVFFELGYAIGKKKTLFIFLNPNVVDAKSNYLKIDILKGVGYTTFSNAAHIIEGIKSQSDHKQVLIEQISAFPPENVDSTDLFYIQSSGNSQSELDAISFIRQSKCSSICDDTYETSYQPLEWYLHTLMECRNLIVHLSGDHIIDAKLKNAKNSLFAGLGHAFGKKVLLIAPKPYYAPIDYSDILFEYSTSDDCVKRISDWIAKLQSKPTVIKEDKELNLLKLGIGCSIAEDEREELSDYFVETQLYRNALKTRNSIYFGRKGTGKTALYIKLCEDFGAKDNYFVVSLKPESTELVEQIKSSTIISDFASENSAFSITWKNVLLSNLLTCIYSRIVDRNKIESTPEEKAIVAYYERNQVSLTRSYFAVLSETLLNRAFLFDANSSNAIEQFVAKHITPLEKLIKEYFSKSKYVHIVILVDNLDKAWDPKADLNLQSKMILSLLETSDKFQINLVDKKNNQVVTNSILFLRKDIYEFVLGNAREPDKVTTFSHEIEWNSSPESLKSLISRRMIHVLNKDETEVDGIWKEYFDFGKEDPLAKITNACLARPRDIIYFIGKMFESACNNSRSSVINSDFAYALDNYIRFLYQNLIAEMNSTYPYINKLIDDLHTRFTDTIELSRFRKLINAYTEDISKSETLINDLFNNGYLIGINQTAGERYFSYSDLTKAEKSVSIRMRLLKRNRFYIAQHPHYARQKHSM